MAKTLYVGNLPFSADQQSIETLFAEYCNVISVKLVSDRETGRPRGFGFVEMDDGGAQAAMTALNGNSFQGRPLRVNEAQPKAPRAPRAW